EGLLAIGDLCNYIDTVIRIPGLYKIPRHPGDFFSRIIAERIAIPPMLVEKGAVLVAGPQEGNLVAVRRNEPVFFAGPRWEKPLKMPVGMSIDLIERNVTGNGGAAFVINISGRTIVILCRAGGRGQESGHTQGEDVEASFHYVAILY